MIILKSSTWRRGIEVSLPPNPSKYVRLQIEKYPHRLYPQILADYSLNGEIRSNQ
jgi:hypothetical protein